MKRKDIRNCVKIAIDNIICEGCTDVSSFGKPFELNLLKDSDIRDEITNDVVDKIDNIINSNGSFEILKMNKISHMLVPKKTFYDFRKCALIEIIDEIKYLSLTVIIASVIEKKRISNNIAFSYRYKPNKSGRLFDKSYNFSAFKCEYKRISAMKKYKVIVECDIANFYDRLNLHRLNSTLLSIDNINTKVVNILDELLLFWANRDSYGLPVGSNASRILAEAFLIEIDNYLLSYGVKFCRFVDDYRFFATDVAEANKILALFVEVLNKHGLSINIGKTKMSDISNYHTDSRKRKTVNAEGVFEVIRGYSGLVPTKFRKLSNSEKNKLKLEQEDVLLQNLKSNSIIEPEDIIKCIKVIISKENFGLLIYFPDILKKYPQFVPYFSDVMFKNKNDIDKSTYTSLLKSFSLWLNTDKNQEYILISIIKMFDASNEIEKKILFDFFRNLKRNTGIYIARSILEQIGNNLSRGELLELKDYYLRADTWEKRQIVNMVLNGLNLPENRPFIKDLKINCTDYFIGALIKQYEIKNKKK